MPSQFPRPTPTSTNPQSFRRSALLAAVPRPGSHADMAKAPASTTIPIEQVEVGALVYAWDEFRRTLVKRRVKRLFRHQHKPVLKVTCIDDRGTLETIESTRGHPFWIEGKGWIPACELQPGDLLRRMHDGPALYVDEVVDAGAIANVYNFEVDGVHNYFVGKAGMLVHNTSGPADVDVDPMAPTLRPEQLSTPAAQPARAPRLIYEKNLQFNNQAHIQASDGKSWMTVGMTEDGLLAGGMVQATKDATFRAWQLMDAAVDAFGGLVQDGGKVRGVKDIWDAEYLGYTDQLDTVNRLTDPNGENPMSLDDAIKETWTGHQARRLGWSEARQYDKASGTPGNYQAVYAEFTLPSNSIRQAADVAPTALAALPPAIDPTTPIAQNESSPWALTAAAPQAAAPSSPQSLFSRAVDQLRGRIQGYPMVDPSQLIPTESINPQVLPGGLSSERYESRVQSFQNGWDWSAQPIDAVNIDGDLYIMDGHKRTSAAMDAGLRAVPVNVVPVGSHDWPSASAIVSAAARVAAGLEP